MVRSSVSALGRLAAWTTPDILVAFPFALPGVLVDGVVPRAALLGVVGAVAVCAGRFVCGTLVGGFGPKNLAQSKITTRDSSEATTIRSSCVSLNFFCGSLTNAPR